jgi:tetratricopeptide (TPR) repeat protein
MKKNKILLFIIFLFVCLTSFSQVSFRAKGPSVVGVNEGFTVSYTINSNSVSNFVEPAFRGVRVLAGPMTSSSSNTTIINGHVSSSVARTYSYTLACPNAGTVIIPAARIKANGQMIASNTLRITVSKNPTTSQRRGNNQSNYYNNQPSFSYQKQQPQRQQKAQSIGIDSKALFVRAIPNKTNVVKGEEVVVSYKLYTLVPVSEYTIEKIPSSMGFWVEELDKQEDPHITTERLNGQIYQVATLRKVIVYPQKSGFLTIKPMSLSLVAHIQTHSQRRFSTGDPFFDQFLNDPFFAQTATSYQSVTKKLFTNAITFNVRELPQEPNNFCGGVGEFSLSSSISTQKTKAFDAFYITYTLSGNGNITLINSLPINLPDEFQVSDPEITDNLTRTGAGLRGTRTFRYLVIPRVQGDFAIPPVNVSYFDIEKGAYTTLTTQGYKIHVDKGNVDKNYAQQLDQRAKYKNMDIEDDLSLSIFGKERHIFDNPIIYFIPFIFIFLLVIAIIIGKEYIKQTSDVVNMKRKKATRVAIKRLKKARKLLDKGEIIGFEDEIASALWTYLLDRFKMKRSEFSIASCKSKLLELKVNSDVVENLGSILERCQYLRFSQDKEQTADETLYNDTINVISSIEEQLKQIKKMNKNNKKKDDDDFHIIPTIILVFAICFSNIIFAQDLEKANHQYNIKNYDSALVLYQRIAKITPSKTAYSSIAATYFRKSDYANSILYYEKALKMAPNDKTIQLNINITRARLVGDCYIMPDFVLVHWAKLISGSLPLTLWLILMIGLFVLFGVLFFLYFFSNKNKQLLFYLSLSCLILGIISFSFGKVRQNIQNDTSYAIVMKSNTAMRQTKNNSSKAIVILYKGQKIKILDKEDNWIKVRTEDRKEGFILDQDYKRI